MNTQGLTDETVHSMMSLPAEDVGHPQSKRSTNGGMRTSRRRQMMELGEGEVPSATVIRSSAPKVHTSKSKGSSSNAGPRSGPAVAASSQSTTDQHNNTIDGSMKRGARPIVISENIRERPAGRCGSSITNGPKRASRFRQRNRSKIGAVDVPTKGGFPSLDAAPVGKFTRKGRVNSSSMKASLPSQRVNAVTHTKQQQPDSSSESALAHMSSEEIADGIAEVESVLSAASIAFLKRRGKQKMSDKPKDNRLKETNAIRPTPGYNHLSRGDQRDQYEKQFISSLLSTVRTPEDMERVYSEAVEKGLAPELPSSSLDIEEPNVTCSENRDRHRSIQIATSLLRSTAHRQRLLGARSLCEILEEDVGTFTESGPKRTAYPELLPVALRCLLDDAVATYRTSSGRLLLTFAIRCIAAITKLCVHPLHAAVMSIDDDSKDPFSLYQTHFMSDISHYPPGGKLYPPTKIAPIENNSPSNACYRSDSSAATAESDSKAFYDDPAWTLLSRMRIIPCIADVIPSLPNDPSTGITIQSMLDILAMLSVRLPGAASAIAMHERILPFILSHCLAPAGVKLSKEETMSQNEENLFRTDLAVPAIKLLSLLARQSKDIAELDLFQKEAISDVLAILCSDAMDREETRLQIWCLIYVRIIMRYGLATSAIQAIISIATPKVALLERNDHVCVHYLQLFAVICHQSNSIQSSGVIAEDVSDGALMSLVWLASSARSCASTMARTMAQSKNSSDAEATLLITSQMNLLASYFQASKSSEEGDSVPVISDEQCDNVVSEVIASEVCTSMLSTAMTAAFLPSWDNAVDAHADLPLPEEAAACSFVTTLSTFVRVIGLENLSGNAGNVLIDKILERMERANQSRPPVARSNLSNPSRQSWLVEAEFSILMVVCEWLHSNQERVDGLRPHLAAFTYSLLGRLSIGHEALAQAIFFQPELFQLSNSQRSENVQKIFTREFNTEGQVQQLRHSMFIYPPRVSGPTASTSLRCKADTSGRSEDVLPLGKLWMWNTLSSTVTEHGSTRQIVDMISHSLGLLTSLECTNNPRYVEGISKGTKLYHLANICLFPESVISDEFVGSTAQELFQILTTTPDLQDEISLVVDFIRACYDHSRLSRETPRSSDSKEDGESVKTLLGSSPSETVGGPLSQKELKALEDFVDDMCGAYVEFGAQYDAFTLFVRFFLRPWFPPKVTASVLSRLHPILNLLTVDGESRPDLMLSLRTSVRGGLPGVDPAARRDPSGVLDAHALSLRRREKTPSRDDYHYLLSTAVLGRNLASSSRRCECGVGAMRSRLRDVPAGVVYDVFRVAESFLQGDGSRGSLVECALSVCCDQTLALESQGRDVRDEWQRGAVENAKWERAMEGLQSVNEVQPTEDMHKY